MILLPLWLACTGKEPAESTDAPRRRALVIGIDGVRADAYAAAETPTFDALFAAGALTTDASTQLTGVTVSGPGWTSILTGREVMDHGVIDNDTLEDRLLPTFPELLQEAGHPVAVVPHWSGIVRIVGTDNVADMVLKTTDAEVGAAIAELVADDEHDLIFAHFDDVDGTGHSSGFDPENPAYIQAIETAEGLAAAAVDVVRADSGSEWLVVLCTDHGGAGTSHGALDAYNRTIPMGVSGGAAAVPDDPNHMDVAVTVMAWFGEAIEDPDGQSWIP